MMKPPGYAYGGLFHLYTNFILGLIFLATQAASKQTGISNKNYGKY